MEQIGFCDYSLERINVDYENVVITIKDDDVYEIKCKNFIGLNYLGQWDENIISCIEISTSDSCIEQAKAIIAHNNNVGYKGGGIKKFDCEWKCLCVKLADGVVIKVVCENVDIIKIFS